ncbi:hypothetical protein [Eupransor demetentiae]|uniref:Uncharacterized protein n=1 Tax=Eupransor demetentiae TaxID=3109584 RepID=A0ABP0ETX3_9LACO|nr:hypothetical protein R54876_GBNLAHCA_01298 [Lactobacillaceae bacterium LMG 33000]
MKPGIKERFSNWASNFAFAVLIAVDGYVALSDNSQNVLASALSWIGLVGIVFIFFRYFTKYFVDVLWALIGLSMITNISDHPNIFDWIFVTLFLVVYLIYLITYLWSGRNLFKKKGEQYED